MRTEHIAFERGIKTKKAEPDAGDTNTQEIRANCLRDGDITQYARLKIKTEQKSDGGYTSFLVS